MVVLVFFFCFFSGVSAVLAECDYEGAECCNRTGKDGSWQGICKNEMICDSNFGTCKHNYKDPFGDKGTCSYLKRDINSSDKSCHIETNNCNIKSGWNVKGLTDDQLTAAWPNCPDCTCGPIKGFALNTCRSGYTNMFRDKYYVITGYNFCDANHVPEIWDDAGYYWNPAKLWNGAGKCRCIDVGAPHSPDYVGDDRMVADPNAPASDGSSKMNTDSIYSYNKNIFCVDPKTKKPDEANPTINTAIGCLPVSISGFTSWIIPRFMGVIGGISFLIMVYGFIMIATSEGDPKKAQAAKETITAAITGLVLSIFAIFLVRLIMIYVLKLPGVK